MRPTGSDPDLIAVDPAPVRKRGVPVGMAADHLRLAVGWLSGFGHYIMENRSARPYSSITDDTHTSVKVAAPQRRVSGIGSRW